MPADELGRERKRKRANETVDLLQEIKLFVFIIKGRGVEIEMKNEQR